MFPTIFLGSRLLVAADASAVGVGLITAIGLVLAAAIPTYLTVRSQQRSRVVADRIAADKYAADQEKVDRTAVIELQRAYAELAATYRSDAEISRQAFTKERSKRTEEEVRVEVVESKNRDLERRLAEVNDRAVVLERKVEDLSSENRSLWRTVEELRRGQYGGGQPNPP